MSNLSMNRRRVLGAGAGLIAMSAISRPSLAALSGKLTFWGGLIFSEGANKLLAKTVQDWGAANGIEVEVVLVNQNETVQKVSAAVASGTMPDVIELNLDLLLLLSLQGVFNPVDDLYTKIGGQHGGWFQNVDSSTNTTTIVGNRTGVPFGLTGNMLLRRTDLLKEKGFNEVPKTWDELTEQAAAVSSSGFGGLGFALANNTDGAVQVSVLQAFGGRIADKDGKKAAINSDGTRAYLKWLKNAADKGVFPPGNATWDGAGDNQAYLSGQTAFIANSGSVGIAALKQDPELYETTGYSPYPAGPDGLVWPSLPWLRAIPKTSKNPEAAAALIEHLANPEFAAAYFKSAIYAPVLQDQQKFPAFNGEDPIRSGLLQLAQSGTAPGFPDIYNAAYADANSNGVVPKMAQRIVVDGWGADRAIDEAQKALEAIYAKY
jgi:multiple sugar transport system substrate-binding protein